MKKQKIILFICLVIPLCLIMADASWAAQGALNNICEKIMDDFYNSISLWDSTTRKVSTWIFWSLALINISWAGVMLVLKQGDLADIIREVFKQFLFIGFWLWILTKSPGFMDDIIDSFVLISSSVPGGPQGVVPSDIIEHAWNVYLACMAAVPWYSISTSIIMAALSIFMLLISVYIAAMMLVLYIESYFAVSVGQIFLGFAGSGWTKEFAISYIKYIVSLGFRILTINMGGALTVNLYKAWALSEDVGVNEITVLLIGAVILFLVIQMIPQIASAIMSGGQFAPNPVSVVGGAATIAAGVTMGGAALAGKAAMTGGKAAVVAGKAASGEGSFMKNITGAAMRTMRENIGQPKGLKTSLLGGMYANMGAKADSQTIPGDNLEPGEKSGSSGDNLNRMNRFKR